MKIVIRIHQVDLTFELRDHVRRRLEFALGRLGPAVRAVRVTLADVNGPRGGVDKRCRIVLSGSHRTIAEAVDADPYAAVDRACERLAHALRRLVERGRELLRVRHVALATRTAKPRRRGRSRAPKIDHGA